MYEKKIRRKIRLRNRFLLFRRNNQNRLLNRLNSQEGLPERISEKLFCESVSHLTNGKGILQLNIPEMENFIIKLHLEPIIVRPYEKYENVENNPS